ncbi:K(+)-transporting ATPase subunit F [soil metagenome]
MNLLVIILGAISSLVALILIVALFIKNEYALYQEIIINKPIAEVFNYISLLKNQDQYNKWWTADPNAKKDFKGTDGTVGFIAAWNSENKGVGKGEQEIKVIKENDRLDCEIRFERPFEGVSQTVMTTASKGRNQTRVSWMFNGRNKYPMNAIFTFFSLDKILSRDLQESLTKLKSNLENP